MFKRISVFLLICFANIFALAQTQQTGQQTQGFTILSKPPAYYTDIARRKGISGKVKLKITFLATGEIGDVVYVSESSKKKKLTKYGLVEKAIEAAKKIKFTPQMENGQPIATTKSFEYGFLIY